MGNRARYGRRTGWRAAIDPDMWRRVLVVGTAGAASMAILSCVIALARDTTGHDWYAAARLTVTELLIAAGFDETEPTEYRTADGTIGTVSRYGLTVTLEARWAREDILAAAWDGAMLGALSGLGGVLDLSGADPKAAEGGASRPAPRTRAAARGAARGSGAVLAAAGEGGAGCIDARSCRAGSRVCRQATRIGCHAPGEAGTRRHEPRGG